MLITAIGGGNKEAAIQATLDRLPDGPGHILLVPTACSTKRAYDTKVPATREFFEGIGIPAGQVAVLHEFRETPTPTRLTHEIGQAALIHTIGGNTPHMLRLLQDWHADDMLAEALRGGQAHSGVSAGALLPFTRMHTNPSPNAKREIWDFQVLDGLGVLHGIATAHGNVHDPSLLGQRLDSRAQNLITMLPADQNVGLSIDHGAAAIFSSEGSTVIRSGQTPEAQVHLIRRNESGNIAVSPVSDPLGQLEGFMPASAA